MNWLERWDAQQERYIEKREERFDVIGDVLAETRAERILDLACGPGSLGTRLAARFPHATIVGLDFDPVLLSLAREQHADDARRSWVETDLRLAAWADGLGDFDAVVSTTALHWLAGHELARVYRDIATRLRPGGVFVNGDHVALHHPFESRLRETQRARTLREADARGSATWEAWWAAVAADSLLAPLWAERCHRFGPKHDEEPLTLAFHLAALRQAGFAEATVVWQRFDNVVIVGAGAA